MNNKKQIEEMAKCMCSSYESEKGCKTCPINWCYAQECATMAFCNGYRKIPKDSVVLSREEYEKLKNESIDKLFADDTFFKEEFKANEEYLRKKANRDYIKLVKKQASKETAEYILKEFANIKVNGSSIRDYIVAVKVVDKIDKLAEQYGVEIEE